ncbi:hypothetical protein V6O07_14345, partial [Arthrospira platensis SPKY2]
NDGRIIDLKQLSRNQAKLETSGIDLTMNWGLGVGPGDLDFALLMTWVERFDSQTTSVDPTNDFVGTIGSGTGSATPEWRGNLTTTYSWGDFRVQSVNRYIDSMSHSNLVTNPNAVATG